VAYLYVVRNICFFADDAVVADGCAVADVDAVPDRGTGADGYAVFEDGGRVDADVGVVGQFSFLQGREPRDVRARLEPYRINLSLINLTSINLTSAAQPLSNPPLSAALKR
jgi:hypothetical protein